MEKINIDVDKLLNSDEFEFKVKDCVCEHITEPSYEQHLKRIRRDTKVPKDIELIEKCIQRVNNFDVSAMLEYAEYLLENTYRGNHIPISEAQLDLMVALLKEAAQRGSCEAIKRIYSAAAIEGAVSLERTVKWFKQITSTSNNLCERAKIFYFLADLYELHFSQYNNAFKCYKKSALLGDEVSMYYLALCYKRGEGTTKDLDKAYYWFEKAGNLGCKSSCHEMAKMTLQKAFDWFNEKEEFQDRCIDHWGNGADRLIDSLNEILPDIYYRVYLRAKKQ